MLTFKQDSVSTVQCNELMEFLTLRNLKSVYLARYFFENYSGLPKPWLIT